MSDPRTGLTPPQLGTAKPAAPPPLQVEPEPAPAPTPAPAPPVFDRAQWVKDRQARAQRRAALLSELADLDAVDRAEELLARAAADRVREAESLQRLAEARAMRQR